MRIFNRKVPVVWVVSNKLKVCVVDIGDKEKKSICKEYTWTADTLMSIFVDIKKLHGKDIRLLLSDDFVYLASIIEDTELKQNVRDYVRKKAQEIIPEELENTVWDFDKKNFKIKKEDTLKSISIYQIEAIVKPFYEHLVDIAKKTGINFEVIEPLSVSFARELADRKEPVLLFNKGEVVTLSALYRGNVLVSEIFELSESIEKINEFKKYIFEKFELEIEKVLISGTVEKADLKKIENFKIENVDIDPVLSLARKESIRGKDEKILNMGIQGSNDVKEPEVKANSSGAISTWSKETKKDTIKITDRFAKFDKRYVNLGVVGVLVVVLITSILVFSKPQPNIPNNEEPMATITPILEPVINEQGSGTIIDNGENPSELPDDTPSEEPKDVDLGQYKIQVLNGTGTSGLANKLKKELENADFNVVQTGNATEKDYETTVVRVKESLNIDYVDALDRTLSDSYTIEVKKDVEENSDYDVIVIIGKN